MNKVGVDITLLVKVWVGVGVLAEIKALLELGLGPSLEININCHPLHGLELEPDLVELAEIKKKNTDL